MTSIIDSTLATYEDSAGLYRERTGSEIPADLKRWLRSAVAYLPKTASIFEIGSGTGRDAAYLQEEGYTAQVSDAASSFVHMLGEQGFDATFFNLVTDDIEGTWDLILADAVLLHLTREEFAAALVKVRNALNPEGRFAFTLKTGTGEEWSTEKLNSPRFFCYWQRETVVEQLRLAGFSSSAVDGPEGWLHVIALR